MFDPRYKKKDAKPELLTGKLLKAGKGSIVEIPFMYRAYAPRMYNVAMSALPGFQHVLPSQQIYTSNIEMPFAKGDRIIMHDGKTMTVDSMIEEINNDLAYYGANIRTGWIITMTGGGEEPHTEKFKDPVYKVTYNDNGSTDGDVPEDTTEYELNDVVTVLDGGTLEKTGYTFMGWSTLSNGTGTLYIEDETFTITSNVTLYAVWEEDELPE